ncbi:Gag-Pol polyprotein [Labeo rohita]|uniref:Gag-Pol polyprotein n=1 Tax=Labeo rohita TaxID=84645 RepID=A0ABQ8MTP1_LABRO|nr:Gag-Pol polyprotein [Labeo rohita]
MVTTHPGSSSPEPNWSLHRFPFKMLTAKHILSCVCHQDWFAAIDLNGMYFYVSILPQHRLFLLFAFEGQAYQYKPLPFGLALSLRVFTKLAEGAFAPLWEKGIQILNCLNNWLILAHSRDLCASTGTWCSSTSAIWGVGAPHEQARAVGAELPEPLQAQDSGPSQILSEAPGIYGSCSHIDTARLAPYETASALIPRWAWHCGTFRVGVTPECRCPFRPWSNLVFLWAGPRLQWHINCLELLAVLLALRWFLPMLRDRHVLVCMDNIATVTYIKRQSGLCSRRMSPTIFSSGVRRSTDRCALFTSRGS